MHNCTALVPVKPEALGVYLYVRSFTESKKECQRGLQDILADCACRGLTVTAQYAELAKPYKIIRPTLWKLLRASRQGRVKVLVLPELAHLSARPWKLRLILKTLYRHDVRLLTTDMELPYNLYRVGLDGERILKRAKGKEQTK